MRLLTDATNITAPDTEYVKGRIKNEVTPGSSNDGTVLNEVLFGDIIETFQKIVSEVGITENGNPDNTTNGHQLLDAIVSYLSASLDTIGYFSSPTLLNGWKINAGGIGYGEDELGKQFLIIDSLDGTSATGDIICNLSNVSIGSHRRFFTGSTDSYSLVPLQIDSSGNLRTNSRLDFICCAIWITP